MTGNYFREQKHELSIHPAKTVYVFSLIFCTRKRIFFLGNCFYVLTVEYILGIHFCNTFLFELQMLRLINNSIFIFFFAPSPRVVFMLTDWILVCKRNFANFNVVRDEEQSHLPQEKINLSLSKHRWMTITLKRLPQLCTLGEKILYCYNVFQAMAWTVEFTCTLDAIKYSTLLVYN